MAEKWNVANETYSWIISLQIKYYFFVYIFWYVSHVMNIIKNKFFGFDLNN